ncbi:MAG: Ig-like domain-containing protein [Burkholderiales bacterium]|nr:Ig-like domain-containing protein [Burkholderiales bacterium]
MSRLLKPCAVAAFLAVAAACGGGGDDTPPLPPPAQPVSLAVAGLPTASMLPGQSAQLNATMTYSDGSSTDVTGGATWNSTDDKVLTVSAAGVILALGPGQAEVVAVAHGLTARGAVIVTLPASRLELLAGNFAEARFNRPTGVAIDSSGTVYVAEQINNTIRKINAAGEVSTLAGTAGTFGSADATGAEARFSSPYEIVTDSVGNVYVADTGNHTVRRITPAGVVSTIAGKAGFDGSADGAGAEARFYNPRGVATDGVGGVYVADSYNHTIRRISPEGVVSTVAGKAGSAGTADGIGSEARFSNPGGIATDSLGNVYVADTNNHTVRRITPAGLVSTLAGAAGLSGSTDGAGSEARFTSPSGIATDSAGNVYVTEQPSHTVRRITPQGEVSTLAGAAGQSGSTDGTGTQARFNLPYGIAADGLGNLVVADVFNHTIRKISPAGIVSTLAGAAPLSGSQDGAGAQARFQDPEGVATDSMGNVYVADSYNATIRKITPAGLVTTLAGQAGAIGSADGIGAAARFDRPIGIATDSVGNVYVADSSNHAIRKITPAGFVSTLVGGIGADMPLDSPTGIAIDNADNIYVADSSRNRIYKVSQAGAVSIFAGTGEIGARDGEGAVASFGFCSITYIDVGLPPYHLRTCAPAGLATDEAGNVYVADVHNHAIRRITPAGVVSTLAGSPAARGSSDGTGGAAQFNYPSAVATDRSGNIYVADTLNHTVRRVTLAGAVTTIVGVAGSDGFTEGALPGGLIEPRGVAISGTSLFITMDHGVADVTNVP